jgi:hypothetical protein
MAVIDATRMINNVRAKRSSIGDSDRKKLLVKMLRALLRQLSSVGDVLATKQTIATLQSLGETVDDVLERMVEAQCVAGQIDDAVRTLEASIAASHDKDNKDHKDNNNNMLRDERYGRLYEQILQALHRQQKQSSPTTTTVATQFDASYLMERIRKANMPNQSDLSMTLEMEVRNSKRRKKKNSKNSHPLCIFGSVWRRLLCHHLPLCHLSKMSRHHFGPLSLPECCNVQFLMKPLAN